MYKTIFIFFTFLAALAKAQQSFPITFVHDGKTVFGTFSTPAGTGPFPTIIINPGSGQNDRNGTFPMIGGNIHCLYPELEGDTLRMYKQLAEGLVDSGFAVLRYDKLEYTYPTTLGTITFHKLWLPVESAIRYVKTRSDVDTNKIILLGHSEGGALIPFIAKNRADVQALISIAGPRTPFDSLLAFQIVDFAQRCNGDVVMAHIQAGQILSYFHTVRTHTWNGSTPDLFGVSPEVWYDYLQAVDSVAYHYNADNLCTLFIGMGRDINVPLSELERFQNEITIPASFWTIPDLVHYMNPYNDPHVSQILTDTIVYWLKHQCLATGTSDYSLITTDNLCVNPNPFHSSITVQLQELAPVNVSVTICDTFGHILFNREVQGDAAFLSNIDLGFLPDGIYFLAVTSGKQKSIRKLIKT